MNKTTGIKQQTYRRQLHHLLAPQLKKLSTVNSWNGLSAIALDWSVIAIAIAVSVSIGHPLAYIAAIVVIAARQHALLIIMHDASHFRLVNNRALNDVLSNCLLAYPMLIRTESYRDNHLKHHKYTNTDHDPDWQRKDGDPDWNFPKTRLQLLRMLIRDLVGGGFLSSLKAIYSLGASPTQADRKPESLFRKAGLFTFWVIAAAVLVWTQTWSYLFLYWLTPAWTILPVILRIRSIAEHFGLENTHELNSSRNFHCNRLETAFLTPHNVGLHLDHHLFPTVPFYHLPQLHKSLMCNALYADLSHQSDGIFGKRRRSVERDVSPAQSVKGVK